MRTKSVLLIFLFFCDLSLATEHEDLIVLAEPGNLGKKLEGKLVITFNLKEGAVSPKSLHVDIKSGVVVGMIVEYPRSVSAEKAQSAINKRFREPFQLTQVHESELGGRWRNADGSLLITCLDDIEADCLQICYLGSKFKRTVTEPSTGEVEK